LPTSQMHARARDRGGEVDEKPHCAPRIHS
jgi:hypothetical protein